MPMENTYLLQVTLKVAVTAFDPGDAELIALDFFGPGIYSDNVEVKKADTKLTK